MVILSVHSTAKSLLGENPASLSSLSIIVYFTYDVWIPLLHRLPSLLILPLVCTVSYWLTVAVRSVSSSLPSVPLSEQEEIETHKRFKRRRNIVSAVLMYAIIPILLVLPVAAYIGTYVSTGTVSPWEAMNLSWETLSRLNPYMY